MPFFVYLLKCSDKSFYCGWTPDIKARLAKHNAGKGAKYTRGRLPAKLVFLEKKKSKSAALKREAEIKKMTRKEKAALVSAKNAELAKKRVYSNVVLLIL